MSDILVDTHVLVWLLEGDARLSAKTIKLLTVRLVSLTPEIAVASTRLPWECHPDPADRIIVATARHLGAVLVTEDLLLLGVATQGHIHTRQASK